MRKKFFFVLAVCLGVSIPTYANEELDLYTWLYEQAGSIHEQYSVIKTVANLHLADSGDLNKRAIVNLNNIYGNLKNNSDRNVGNLLGKLLCIELGELKYASAAGDIWRFYQITNDYSAKGEALNALGRIRSMEYLPHVIKVLSDLNEKAPVNREEAEKLAYGAILALEKYRVEEAFYPVFYACNSWYSDLVKNVARQVLPGILEDPTDALIVIIKTASLPVKLLALEQSKASKAANSSKIRLASFSLADAWTLTVKKTRERTMLSSIRKAAMGQLASLGVPEEALPYLDRSYREGLDIDEKLSAISALSRSPSDAAVQFLASYLTDMNSRRKANVVTQIDEQLVRFLIPALGRTKSEIARTALNAVEYMDWQPAVVRLAAEALKELP